MVVLTLVLNESLQLTMWARHSTLGCEFEELMVRWAEGEGSEEPGSNYS